jgi:hypothetical protein
MAIAEYLRYTFTPAFACVYAIVSQLMFIGMVYAVGEQPLSFYIFCGFVEGIFLITMLVSWLRWKQYKKFKS